MYMNPPSGFWQRLTYSVQRSIVSRGTNRVRPYQVLARTPQCQECVVKQVFRYMSGRQDTPADRPMLSHALEEFRKSDYHFKELMVALVKSRESPDSRRSGNVADHH